jgi:hypothetical protein
MTSVVNDEFITCLDRKVIICLQMNHEILSISANSHLPERKHYIYHLDVLDDNYEHLHLKNGKELRNWILECAKNNHIQVDVCISSRIYEDTSLIIFTWNDDYVERLEIPSILLMDFTQPQ